MTGWIIAGSIIAAILALLLSPVRLRFEYSDELRLKISWLFLTFVRIPPKTKKQARRDKKAEKDAKAAAISAADEEEKLSGESPTSGGGGSGGSSTAPAREKPEKSRKEKRKGSGGAGGQKLTLKDILELVKLVWDSLGKPLKRLLRGTRIYGFRLYIVCGGEDAAEAALNFGRTNIAAGAALAFLDGCFTLKQPDMNVTCDFRSEETLMECSFHARLTVISALAFLLWALGRLVKNYLHRSEAAAAVDKLRNR